MIAPRTRCFASWHARSPMPTIEKEGTSLESRCASASTRFGSRPTTAYVSARASTPRRYGPRRDECVPTLRRECDFLAERATDEHGFVVLARATSRAAVHVPLDALLEP